MQKQSLEIDGDAPQTNPDLDKLNYRRVAESIADGINSMCPTDGMVIAILAGWGFGKTTTINYVLEFLRRKNSNVQTVSFNPWWFSGHEDLVRQFLQEISDAVRPEITGAENIRNALADLAGAVEWKPKVLGAEIDMKQVLGSRAKALVSSKSVPAIKKKIGSLLREHELKILCVVDDVDRLSAEEVRDLFRCIKAIGNLSNVVYLLAFDPLVVSDALDDIFKNRGKDYLDKIIQVSFHLPQPNPDDITDLVSEGIDKIFEHLEIQNFDYSRLSLLYGLGIKHMVRSPRDITRLINALRVTLPAVHAEVNPSDFIAIESIRLFQPKIYEVIRTNKDEFADLLSAQFGRTSTESLAEFHNSWFSEVPLKQQRWLKDFLGELFPKLRSAWGNSFHDKGKLIGWRKSLRVCSPDIFDAYFTFAPPPKTISAKVLNQVLNDLESGQSLEYLREKIHSENNIEKESVLRLLVRLADHVTDDIEPTSAEKLFCFLLDAWRGYKHSTEISQQHLVRPDNLVILDTLIWKLFERTTENRRKSLFMDVLKGSFAVTPMVLLVRDLSKQHGKFGTSAESTQLISLKDLDDISDALIDRVQKMMNANEVQGWEDFSSAINLFSLTHVDRVPWFVSKLQESHEGSVALMFVGGGVSYNFSASGRTTRYTVELDRIRSLVEPSQLINAAGEIISSALQPHAAKEIAKEFLRCVETGQSSPQFHFNDEDND